MKRLMLALCLGFAVAAQAQFTVAPLSSFGGGDGWLAPNEGGYTYLGTGNLERGLAFNPVTGHLLLVSRNGGNNIRILDSLTGADLGAMNVTGISGGTFAVNMVAASSDGSIYVGNLTTGVGTSPYKVYRYAGEGATPSVVYSGDAGAGITTARAGDSISILGSGSGTRLAVGYGGVVGYGIIDPTAGTATGVTAWGAPAPAAGDFRLGIALTSPTEVWGSQGSPGFRYSTFSGANGTLQNTFTPYSTAERMMAYTVLGGRPLLAGQSTGDGHISIYDIADPLNPINVGYGLNITGSAVANANGTGELAWGNAVYNGDGTWSETLYALDTNNGIQAFIVVVPEPSALALLGLGALAFWRRARE